MNKQAPFRPEVSTGLVSYEERFTNEILSLDKSIYGEDRNRILLEHISDCVVFKPGQKVEGVYFPSLANGLIIAENPIAGIELLKQRLQWKDWAIFPKENIDATNFMNENNFEQVRISRRMLLGKKRIWKPSNIYHRVSGSIG